ncbi:MAG: InlB B-repeat-containing protein [Firmicutes bacterium]|nr:InlB B-repeat-containing protein [Bacillota bacterium]
MKKIVRHKLKLAALMLGLALMMTVAFALMTSGGEVKRAHAYFSDFDGDPMTEECLRFESVNDVSTLAAVTGWEVSIGTCGGGDVVLPAVFQGKPVIRVGYFGDASLTSITISPGIQEITANAISQQYGLTSVYIPASVVTVGSKAIWDMYPADVAGITIYCEAPSKPAGWASDWNPASYTVVWGHSLYPVVPLPPDPELEHHDFGGWFMDENFTIPYAGQLIYENTPLYAKFIVKIYHITYVTGVTGLTVPQKNVTALTAAGTLAAPSRTGFTFTGWFLDELRTVSYVPITSMTGNVTLYAGFEQIILTVTFYVNGSVYTTVEVPYGASLSEAVAAAQTDNEILTALFSDPYLHNALSVNTVLTGNMSVHAELGTGAGSPPGFFGRVGNWFAAYWIWLLVCVGLAGIGVASGFIIRAKREG